MVIIGSFQFPFHPIKNNNKYPFLIPQFIMCYWMFSFINYLIETKNIAEF